MQGPGLEVIDAAKAIVSARNRARGTDFNARPQSTASAPVIQRPVQMISLARCTPMRRASRIDVTAGITPASVCTSPISASSAIRMKSQPIEISKPPARA